MAKETTIAKRTGVSKRTQAYANQKLSGDARIRSAIYNRAYSLMERAREQEASPSRIINAMDNLLSRNNMR